MNIFIEGLQGTGKTTLLRNLEKRLPNYKVYYEGKLSPVELAWSSYMTLDEFEKTCEIYSDVKPDLELFSVTEDSHKVIAYTKILTDYEGFHKHLEEYTIYHGNITFAEFRSVVLKRYNLLNTNNNIFESSFFQYSITTMMLFYEMNEEEILEFYREVFEVIKVKNFKLIYLDAKNVFDIISKIKVERVDLHCNEVWFPPLAKYIETSPLGEKMGYKGFEGVVTHLEQRRQIELRVINEVLGDCVLVVNSEEFDIDENIISKIQSEL